MRGMARRRERTPSPEPWLVPPPKPPTLELPPLDVREQAEPAHMPDQEIEVPDLETENRTGMPVRENTAIENARTPLIQPTLHPTPNRTAETEGRPRRETRRPIKYADYECYTLQSITGQSKGREKTGATIGQLAANKQTKDENSRKLFHFQPAINSKQEYPDQMHQQETAPFCINARQSAHVLKNISTTAISALIE